MFLKCEIKCKLTDKVMTFTQTEEICHCCSLQVLIPERQMSEGLLEVLSQRADLSLFWSSLLVSGQSCRPATSQIKIIILYIYGLNQTHFAFIQKHNLTNEMEESSGFTMFAPTDSAIREYLRRTGKESLVLYKHTQKNTL